MASEQSAYIAGVGQTEFKRHGGIMDRSQFQVAAEAVLPTPCQALASCRAQTTSKCCESPR